MMIPELPDQDERSDEGDGDESLRPAGAPPSSNRSRFLPLAGIGLPGGDPAALQELLDVLPVAVYTCDPLGVITFYNKEAARLWGRAPGPGDSDARFCGSYRLWRLDGTSLPHDQTPMAVALRQDRSFQNEKVVIERPDGTRLIVLVSINPIHDSGGRLVGAINAFHDITAIRQAEEAQARLGAIVEASDNVIISKSLDGIIQSWNAGAERIFGYPAAEAVGQSIFLIIPPELQDEERMILQRLRHGERIEHFETVRLTRQGERLDISLTISPLRNAEGVIIGASKVARDITGRKRTERALKAKEAELELITETTPLILTRCSHDLRYRFANRAAAALFKLAPEELVGRQIVDIVGMEALSIIEPYIEQVLQGRPVEFEVEFPAPVGALWLHVNYIPERDEGGRVIGWVTSAVDITKRKRAEEALQELAETLEERVREGTRQVRRLAYELVTAEQSVRQHLAHLLHDDLQQMLFAVEIQLGFLRGDTGRKDEFDEVVETIRQALNLTRQLSVELSPPVLEGEGLHETLAWLAHHITDAYQLKVTFDAEDTPTASLAQRILLYQNVRELLFNVVKHAGVQEAQVRLRSLEDGFTVTVSDPGRGFEPPALTDEGNEHLGLRSVAERLQLLGGRVDIDSGPGRGTRITLFLPYEQPGDRNGSKA